MGNEKYIMLINEKDKTNNYEIELLCSFLYENNKYIIYSKNEKDFNENNIIYPAKIIEKEGKEFIRELTEEEYNTIKNIIKIMINYSKENKDER